MKEIKDLEHQAYERARVNTRGIKYAVTLVGEMHINQLGQVVSVHLAGCTFQPVLDESEGTIIERNEVRKEMEENRLELTVALVSQAIENLATKEIERRLAIELGVVTPITMNHEH